MGQELQTVPKGNRSPCKCLLHNVQSFKCKPKVQGSVQNFSRRNVPYVQLI